MKYIALFPTVIAFVALILSFLCVFAGSKPGYLESYNIVTLNTSRIGVDIFEKSAGNSHHGSGSSGGIFSGVEHEISHEFHHLSSEVQSEVEHAINDALASMASAIGLHDFYSVHVLDFCEGFYSPSGTSSKDVTSCSNTQGLFTFHPSKTFARELREHGANITLSDLHWPSAIDEAIDGLKLAFNIMFVLYCLAITATGFAFWSSVLGVFLQRRLVSLVNIFLTQFSFFTLMIASAIVTSAATQATDVINKYGKEIDVNATKGEELIKLTWTTTLLMFLASMIWLSDFCIARRKEKKLRLKEMQ